MQEKDWSEEKGLDVHTRNSHERNKGKKDKKASRARLSLARCSPRRRVTDWQETSKFLEKKKQKRKAERETRKEELLNGLPRV